MFCEGCTGQMRRMWKVRKGLPGKQHYNGKQGEHMKTKKKHWYDYLWIWSIIYFALGFFNILFAWLGMIDFLLPIILAAFGGNKFFCMQRNAIELSPPVFAAEGNSIVSWAEISNAPETSQHRNGWHPNGFDMVF